MKTILIPTDFSDNALNACRYAIVLAKQIGAKLILHHSFDTPIYAGEVPYDIIVEERVKLKKQTERKLKTQAIEIEHSGIKEYELSICQGTISDTIVEIAKEKKADLIVMGTQGADSVADALFGTHTAHVMERSGCPVMAIPSDWHFDKAIKTITYATDFHKDDLAALKELINLLEPLKAQITLLHFETDTITSAEEKALMNDFRERVIAEVDYFNLAFQMMYGPNVENKLKEYLEEGYADILAMSTHKRHFIERLFVRSLTQEMVLDSHVPLIAFHRDNK